MLILKSLLILFLLYSPVIQTFCVTKRIYVSTKGDDKNEGSKRSPCASFKAAVDLAMTLWRQNNNGVNVEIYFEPGIYRIMKPIYIESENQTNSRSTLLISGAGKGSTIISGGMELPQFMIEKKSGLWKICLKGIEADISEINQLFVNNKRAILARFPNADNYIVPLKAKEACTDAKTQRYFQTVFLSEDNSAMLKAIGNDSNRIVASFLHYWTMTRRKVLSLDINKNSICVEGHSLKLWNFFTPKYSAQLYFENAKSFLDCPGEFYFDSNEKMLYYYPREGENIKDARAVIPQIDRLIFFKGSKEKKVSNVCIKDLTFSDFSYNMPPKGEDAQQAVHSKDAVIMADWATNITLSDCEICHTGLNAVWFRMACSDCRIERSWLHDLGTGGVKIGVKDGVYVGDPNVSNNITIENNIICEGGRALPPGEGVTIFKASDCNITHNDIYDFYYSGISVGWTWGFDNSPAKRNKVCYNHIHHLGWGALSDMGGIYTLGRSDGTVISNNVIHDVYAYGADGNGIYLDEGTSNITVTNNIVYCCKSSGFAQHYGKNNKIFNNIFANNLRTQLSVGTAAPENQTLTFRNNVVFSSKGKIFSNDLWANYSGVDADYNLYWIDGEEKIMHKDDLLAWREKTGKDINSINIDPVFLRKRGKLMNLTNKKGLRQISFTSIDYSKAGIYGCKEWIILSKMNIERISLFNMLVEKYEIEQTGNKT